MSNTWGPPRLALDQLDVLRRAGSLCVSCCLGLLPRGVADSHTDEVAGSGPVELRDRSHYGQAGDGLQAAGLARDAAGLRQLREALRASAGRPGRGDGGTLHETASRLTGLLCREFIPKAGCACGWPLAAGEVVALLWAGAGPDGGSARAALQPVFLVPILWALALAHPEAREPPRPSGGRAERLRHTLAADDLFAALAAWARTPPSVEVAAGALALVARPRQARAWVERARHAARANGADRFADFFDRAVTPRQDDPSTW